MRQERLPIVVAYAAFSLIWIWQMVHYYEALVNYGAFNVHVNTPALYIAVESWFLLSLVVSMLLIIKLVGEICRSDADEK